MKDDLFNLTSFLRALGTYKWWAVAIEWLRHRGGRLLGDAFPAWHARARLLRGIALVLIGLYLIVKLAAVQFELVRLEFLFRQFLGIASVAIIVVFQPELRRALMRLGETRLFRGWSSQVHEEIEQLVEAATFCSKRKIGALIAIEREVGLGGIAESGTRINADLSAALLNTIFWPNSPLHDLGVVDQPGKDRLRRRAVSAGRGRHARARAGQPPPCGGRALQ